MAYLVINDFRFGLDKRRIDLALRPGALNDIVNAHINQGGEIEKRKAFLRTAIASSIDPTVITKGFQEGPDGIYVFSNRVDPGGWPTPIKQQLLQYPDFHAIDTTYPVVITVEINKVVSSTVFGGKMFVIAEFVGGVTLCYYDGTIVPDFYIGRILLTSTNSQVVSLLTSWINSTAFGYTATRVQGDTFLSVFGPPGASYTIIPQKVSAAGTITEKKIAEAVAPVPGAIAKGSFQVIAGSSSAGVNKITVVKVGATSLLNAGTPVDFDTDTVRTAIALAVSISAFSTTSGYTATSEGSRVVISSTTEGSTPNDKDIEVDTAGDVCIGVCIIGFTGTGFSLNTIVANGTNIIAGGPLTFPATPGQALSAFVETVAANIRTGVATHGYLAKALNTLLYLSKAVTKASDAAINVVVDLTGSGNAGSGSPNGMIVTTTPSKVFFKTHGPGGYGWLSEPITVKVSGGTPPYSYFWDLDPGSDIDMVDPVIPAKLKLVPLSPNSATTQYVADSTPQLLVSQGLFPNRSVAVACEVVDVLGVTVRSPTCSLVLPGGSTVG